MASADFTRLGREQFISLTTFRRTGEPVPTTVWAASDGDTALVVTTPSGSGKVKRLRSNPRVDMVTSSRMGKINSAHRRQPGVAELVTDGPEHERLTALIAAKYGFQFTIAVVMERLFSRRGGTRTILRITPAPES